MADDEQRRVEGLLGAMTLAEKVGQMSQANGPDADAEAARAGSLGSCLNVAGAEARNALQRAAVEESRLGIPLVFGRDVIHGYRTIFPIPLGQAAAWDPAGMERAAAVAAREAAAEGIDWTFAPMVDVTRDPRWGRIAESFGEDPHLSAVLAAAAVRGYQTGPDGERIAACAKHFAGYGAAEGGRDYNTAELSERTLRETILPPFRAAVRAGCLTLMSGFHEIAGIPATGNRWLLTEVLREEWGFDGLVVSDWASVAELLEHGFVAGMAEAAREAIGAGLDMEMVSTAFARNAADAVAAGELSEAAIDRAVERILRVKHRLGLFDRPYADPERAASVLLADDHRAAARDAAARSLVLLENRGALPLAADPGRLAVIGPLADAAGDQLGCWAPDGRGADAVTPLAALRERLGPERVVHEPGLASPRDAAGTGVEAARRVAEGADAVVAFLGEPMVLSGEAHSRAFLEMPGGQAELLEALVATGKPVILVVMAGRPLTIGPLLDRCAAVLMAWHPGTEGGPALADVLLGAREPGGRLPVSWPHVVGQVPLYYNHKRTGRPPRPDMPSPEIGTPEEPVGYAACYLDAPHTPRYPFGYGLGYTSFAFGEIAVSPESAPAGEPVEVAATVTNTGSRSGETVAELYVRDPVASVTRPVRELKGFQRLALAPGESERVRFVLRGSDLAFPGREMAWRYEAGAFHVWIAPHAEAEGASGSFVWTEA